MTSLELPVPDLVRAAAAYGRVLGITFTDAWLASAGAQVLSLRLGAPGDRPVVRLEAEPGTPPLDLVRLGIRWVRDPAG